MSAQYREPDGDWVRNVFQEPAPDLRHSLSDAIAVMKLVDEARRLAEEMPSYRFGALPALLGQVPHLAVAA